MAEINENKFIQKTEEEVKKYDILKKAFQNIYSAENTLYDKRKSAFDSIIKIKETDNQFLRDIYSEFTTEMKKLEDYRNNQMAKIHDKIIPATSYYSSKAKLYKQNLGRYKDLKNKNVKKQNEKIIAQSNREGAKAEQIEREIDQNKNVLSQTGQSLEKDILLFENDRIMDNKYLFLHFIHSELAYHANALEKLSQLYKKIQDIEPIEGLKEFQDNYGLNTVDLAEFGYNEREIQKKKRLREQQQNRAQNIPPDFMNNIPNQPVMSNNNNFKSSVFGADEIENNNNMV